MGVTMQEVKQLRGRTGAGIMDCKKALGECDGDIEKAIDFLREKGIAKAAKKAGREAAEGMVFSYIHMNGKVGTLVELNCETDFVARTDEFQQLGHELCLHIAAADPTYVSPDDVPGEDLEREKEIYRKQAAEEGKPEHILDKIAEGKVRKFYEESCLLEQNYVRDPDKKIKDLVKEHIAQLGENIVVGRFQRYAIGS
ncbi:MAG: translation elongation factor Ts [Synergistales bacterium]|nr:translation elongation factor Ts [Synergistales bacterium]